MPDVAVTRTTFPAITGRKGHVGVCLAVAVVLAGSMLSVPPAAAHGTRPTTTIASSATRSGPVAGDATTEPSKARPSLPSAATMRDAPGTGPPQAALVGERAGATGDVLTGAIFLVALTLLLARTGSRVARRPVLGGILTSAVAYTAWAHYGEIGPHWAESWHLGAAFAAMAGVGAAAAVLALAAPTPSILRLIARSHLGLLALYFVVRLAPAVEPLWHRDRFAPSELPVLASEIGIVAVAAIWLRILGSTPGRSIDRAHHSRARTVAAGDANSEAPTRSIDSHAMT